MPPITPSPDQRARDEERPGQHGAQQYRQEEPDRLVAAMHRAGETLEMFMDKKETGEFRVPEGNRHKPGGDYGQEQQQAGHKAHTFDNPPLSGQQQVDEDDPARKDNPDQPLGQHCQGAEQVEQIPGECTAAPPFMLRGNDEGPQRCRQAEGQQHVGQDDAGLEHEAGRCAQDDGGNQCCPSVVQFSGDQVGCQHGGQAAQGGRQAGGKLVLPEYPDRSGIQPVKQWRLLEVFDVVEGGGNQVASFQHLAGDFGVAALVRVDQRQSPQKLEKRDAQDKCQGQQIPEPAMHVAAGIGLQILHGAPAFSRRIRSKGATSKGGCIRMS